MSSADYKAFTQAEIEERKRLADVYQGVVADKGAPAEHLSIDHLEVLLSGPLPRDLRALYMREYDDMRAVQRAVAMVNLSRKDFYDDAAQTMIRERELLSAFLALSTTVAPVFLRGMTEEFKSNLGSQAEEFEQRKNEVVDRLKVSGGLSAEAPIDDECIVRTMMKDVPGTNNRGVSTGIKTVE